MAFTETEDDSSDNHIAVSYSGCTYEFNFKPLSSVANANSTRQNIISSDTEVIHSFITEAEEEVARCSDEVSRLRAIIEKVERHQNKVQNELSIHKSFIAPIRRLPPELLALVFSFFCSIDFWDKPLDKKKSRASGSIFREPFILATVCSHWRSIVVSTPSIWSTIVLAGSNDIDFSREDYQTNYSEEIDKSQTFPEDVLEVALDRSARYPLKLWIECFDDSYFPSIFKTKLRQVCSRVEHLYLGGDSDPFHIPNSPNLVFDRLSTV
ncbi:hypothetical protein C8J56DRAFT_828037, partial [Mycena floridula]